MKIETARGFEGRYVFNTKNMYFFSGYQGQNVFIVPDKDLVVVRMGLTKNADVDLLLSEIIKNIK